MEIAGWEERYRAGTHPREDADAAPTPLLMTTAQSVAPGRALDLACGAGRNAIWLAAQGWAVTAVDGAAAAIDAVRQRAANDHLTIDAHIADLTRHEYRIDDDKWDLISICYYLQRDLFEPAKRGVAPGGLLLAIVHTTQGNEQPTPNRLNPGELAQFFADWQILHHYEGQPCDPAHRRAVAEIVARKPR